MSNQHSCTNIACTCIPAKPEPFVSRKNQHYSIKKRAQELDVLVVVGESGIGKTTLLADLACCHSPSVCLFFEKSISLRRNLDDVIQELGEQFFYLNYNKLPNKTITRSDLKKYQRDCTRRLASRNQTLFYIIDGLDDLLGDSERYVKDIMELMLIGDRSFKFIVGMKSKDDFPVRISKLQIGELHIPPYSESEVKKALIGLGVDELVDDIQEATNGVPGQIERLRRVIAEDAENAKEVCLNFLSSDLAKLELEQLEGLKDHELDAICIISNSDYPVRIDHLRRSLDLDEGSLSVIKNLSAITYNEKDNFIIIPQEETRRNFRKHLQGRKTAITSYIDFLRRSGVSIAENTGQFASLLKVGCDEEYILELGNRNEIIQMCETRRSLAAIRQSLLFFQDIAMRNKNFYRQLALALQASCVSSIKFSEHIDRLSVQYILEDNYDEALAAADRSFLIEERLKILVGIGARMKMRNISIPNDVLEEIRHLSQNVNFSEIGDYAWSIIPGLIEIDIGIATSAIQSVFSSSDEGSIKKAHSSFALHCAINRNRDEFVEAMTNNGDESFVNDDKFKSLSAAASIFVSKHTAQSLVNELNSIESEADKIYFISRWLTENPGDLDSHIAIKEGVRVCISSPEYVANANDYLTLLKPCLSLDDKTSLTDSISSINNQLQVIGRVSPIESMTKLRLLLAEITADKSTEDCISQVDQVMTDVNSITDHALRASLTAHICASCHRIKEKHGIETPLSIDDFIDSKLYNQCKEMWETTADHYFETKPIIESLAEVSPSSAMLFALELNTESRRDRALYLLIDKLTPSLAACTDNIEDIQDAVNEIKGARIKESAILKVCDTIDPRSNSLENTGVISKFIDKNLNHVRSPQSKCLAMTRSIIADHTSCPTTNLENKLQDLKDACDSIEQLHAKSNVCANIHSELSTTLTIDNHFIELSKSTLDGSPFAVIDNLSDLAQIIEFFTLSLSKIAKWNDMPSFDRMCDRLIDLTNVIPEPGEKLTILADAAEGLYSLGYIDHAKHLATHLKPILEAVDRIPEECYKNEKISYSFPALFLFFQHQSTTLLKKLDIDSRTEAIRHTRKLIFHKPTPGFPAAESPKYDLVTKEDIDYAANLLELTIEDQQLYCISCDLIRSIKMSRRLKNLLTKAQIADYAGRVEQASIKLLPDKRNIQHDGYLLAIKAECLSALESSTRKEWEELINKVEEIPNTSDRSFLYNAIGEAITNKVGKKQASLAKECFDKSELVIKDICSKGDMTERYLMLSRSSEKFDKSLAKSAIANAIACTSHLGEELKDRLGQDIVDQAYRISPEFAAEIARKCDDDPVRSRDRNISKGIEFNSERDKITSQMKKGSSEIDFENLGSKMVRSLSDSLEQERTSPIPPEHHRHLLHAVSRRPLCEVSSQYQLISINHIKHRFKDFSQDHNFSDALIESLEVLTEISKHCHTHTSGEIKAQNESNEIVITPDPTGDAEEIIRDFIADANPKRVILVDPYFTHNQVFFLKWIGDSCPDCTVDVACAKPKKDVTTAQEDYISAWRDLSDQDPPPTNITMISSVKDGGFPIHDRYLIIPDTAKGLKLGTSINGYEKKRDSGITTMNDGAVKLVWDTIIKDLLDPRCREYRQDRVNRIMVSI